jgi:hypothetical protein
MYVFLLFVLIPFWSVLIFATRCVVIYRITCHHLLIDYYIRVIRSNISRLHSFLLFFDLKEDLEGVILSFLKMVTIVRMYVRTFQV